MARDTRERMLRTTASLLMHRGYYGTALSEILKQSDAPRGSLYFHFPGGKDQLVLEATRAAVEQTTRELRESLAAAPSAARGVRNFVEAAARIMRESNFTFGCPVAPVILDATGDQPELAELCRNALEEWIGLLQHAFVRAGLPRRRAHTLALLVESTLEGVLVIARAYRDCAPILSVAVELEAVVEAALPRRRRARAR
jgi:TetR/AcrR family transcriptional regulator, lmrAB and yxaGH operons repressor